MLGGLVYKAEAVGGYASPADSFDSLDVIEVPVVGKNVRFVLLRLSGYPNVMPRNGPAVGFQLAPDFRIGNRCGCI